jgi:hypothetical protein
MTSNADLPTQDTIKQKTALSLKPLIWKVVFYLLLFINIIIVSLWLYWLWGPHTTADLGGLFLLMLSLPFAIVDLIALLYYGFKHRPHGKARVIWDAAFILVIVPILYALVLFMILPIVMHW